MLRNDDDLTSGAQAFFEQRARDTSEAMTFARRQQDETDAATDAEHQQQARDWIRSQALGDALPSPDDYDYPRMIREGVIPQKDGANRVPLPPQYWKPGRLLVNGVDLATGQRILSRVPLEDRVLGLAQDDDEEAVDVRKILSQAGPEHLDEIPPTQRRALESWMEHHGIMVAQGGTQGTMTDAPPAARVGRAGVPYQPPSMKDVTEPATALLDSLAGALKGGVAQTLGLPGDLESLVRMLTGGEQVMPTTEDMEKNLPPVVPPSTTDLVTGQNPRNASAELGQQLGEVVGLGKAPGMAAKGVAAGVRAVKPTAIEVVRKVVEKTIDATGGRMHALPRVDDVEWFNIGPTAVKPRPIAPGQPLYRETNIGGVDDLLMDDRRFTFYPVHVTDRAELAIGQGHNKGVMVEFRPDAVSGAEHRKPMTGDIAGREYVADVLAPQAVQSITFQQAKDVASLRGLTKRALQSFNRETLPDGRVRFTRKPEAPQ